MDQLEKELLKKLSDSGRVRMLDLVRSDIKNYRNLKAELELLDQEYAKEVITRQEKVYFSDEDIKKIKSPAYSDELGGHVEPLDKKIIRLNEEKEKANQELRNFYQENNYIYFNRKWILMSRIAFVDDILSRLDECDKQFIIDLYISPIGFKSVMKKYNIENSGDIYRKASNILKNTL